METTSTTPLVIEADSTLLVEKRDTETWSLWQKLALRFFFIYFTLYVAPWTLLNVIPGVYSVMKWYYVALDWLVNFSNDYIFHAYKQLVPPNGSGDTSYNWTQVWLFLSIAAAGTLVWSITDRRRKSYTQLNYWLCLCLRYFVAYTAFQYGFSKVFALQMQFPTYSQLATPLGDFLPMRFSWVFIGYSTPYQVASGVIEVLVGLALLFRRTTTLGVMMGTAVFLNVMLLNLCYDIPVKLFSMHLVAICLFLLANEAKRISCFFMLNKPANACSIYSFPYQQKRMRRLRIGLKMLFLVIILVDTYYTYDSIQFRNPPEPIPFKSGVYDVASFKVNNVERPPLLTDTTRWQDFIIERGSYGSINTSDTMFTRRYGRGYFRFKVDSASQSIRMNRSSFLDTTFIGVMHYSFPDNNTINLTGKIKSDSLSLVLKKSNRHFQLAERQFHWLSEYNR